MYPFIYKVTIYNEYDEKVEKVAGVTFAETWTEAMCHIEGYYGDELIDVHIDGLEEGSCLELSIEEAERLVKE